MPRPLTFAEVGVVVVVGVVIMAEFEDDDDGRTATVAPFKKSIRRCEWSCIASGRSEVEEAAALPSFVVRAAKSAMAMVMLQLQLLFAFRVVFVVGCCPMLRSPNY